MGLERAVVAVAVEHLYSDKYDQAHNIICNPQSIRPSAPYLSIYVDDGTRRVFATNRLQCSTEVYKVYVDSKRTQRGC